MTELYQPSPELARIVGNAPLSWVKIMELIVDHIREHGLKGVMSPYIEVDEPLRAIVGDRNMISPKELTRIIKNHITPTGRRV